MRASWVWAVSMAVLAGAFAANAGEPATAAALEGRQFESVAVTRAGAPLELVVGTRIALRFDGGRLSASAGGNTMSGGYEVIDGRLVIAALAMTEMGVPPDRAAQDRWLADVLTSRPLATLLRPGRLELRNDAHTIELTDGTGAAPGRGLEGTTWRGDAMRTGDVVGHSESMRKVVLRFAAGELQVDTGLNTGTAPYKDDGPQLAIGPLTLTKRGGTDEAMALERHIVAVLSSRSVGYRVEGDTLTLSGDGVGLSLRADAELFREIVIPSELASKFPSRDGPIDAPVLLRSREEAIAALGEGGEILTGFDFAAEHLVWCAWSGSSGDAFQAEVVSVPDGPPRVEISITTGITRDLVPHRRLLAVKVGTPVAFRGR